MHNLEAKELHSFPGRQIIDTEMKDELANYSVGMGKR